MVSKVFGLAMVGMAATVACLVVIPLITLAGFLLISLWHFGHPEERFHRPVQRVAATLARGGLVLGLPLTAWPESIAGVASELIALLAPVRAAWGLSPVTQPSSLPSQIGFTGLVLISAGVAGWVVELTDVLRRPSSDSRRRETFGDMWSCFPLSMLLVAAPPLLATGVFFLVWHAWQQQPHVASRLTGSARLQHPLLQVLHVHRAALPLLILVWISLGAAWWMLSTDCSLRNLALLSLLVYVAVTPSHESLCSLMRPRLIPAT